MNPTRPVEPLLLAQLMEPLHHKLIALLSSLSPDDWNRPTAAGHWRVRDVAAHLLDGDIRQISFRRDEHPPVEPPFPIDSYSALVRFIDLLNSAWVDAFGRVSPTVLVELLRWSGPEAANALRRRDPFEPALFGVAWAGEFTSLDWFDTAREYTERWHHQQQIREAVGAEPLTDPEWLHPVLDTFVRALPHAYRVHGPSEGDAVAFTIEGAAGGEWSIVEDQGAWKLVAGTAADPMAHVTTDQDTAWRLMTKGLSSEDARSRVLVEGDAKLVEPFLSLRAIMG